MFLFFWRGNWTLEEDLQILEETQKQGLKWANIAKVIQGRNENSVKNRYFSLLGLHLYARKKGTNSIKLENDEKVKNKIEEIKDKINEKNLLANAKKRFIMRLDSEDIIDEEFLTPKKLKEMHVTFSEESIKKSPYQQISTKNSIKETISSKDFKFCSTLDSLCIPFDVSKNKSPPQKTDNFQLEEEGNINSLKKSRFYKTSDLSRSLSKLSISSNLFNTKKDEFPINKMDSQNSFISSSDVNFSIPKSITSSSNIKSKNSYTSSLISHKEKKLLISTINNLKSDASSKSVFSGNNSLGDSHGSQDLKI